MGLRPYRVRACEVGTLSAFEGGASRLEGGASEVGYREDEGEFFGYSLLNPVRSFVMVKLPSVRADSLM
jgi:hypothetical protein